MTDGRIVADVDIAPASPDPPTLYDYTAAYVAAALHEPLLRVGPGGDVRPGLAGWSLSGDGSALSLFIREDARFSNGRPVLARDVAASLLRTERLGAGRAKALLRLLVGACPVEEAVAVRGRREVRVQLRAEGHRYLVALGSGAFAPVTSDAPPWSVCTGPYCASAWAPDRTGSISLRQNPWHPTTGAPSDHSVQELVFEVVPDPYDSLARWRRGETHLTCNTMFPHQYVDDADVKPYLLSTSLPLIGVFVVSPSLRARAGRALAALSASVPRASIAAALGGCVEPLGGFWPEGPEPVASEGAAMVGEMPERLSLAVADYYPNLEVCRYTVEEWASRLGVRVDIDVVDYHGLGRATDTHDLSYQILWPPFPNPRALLLGVSLRALGLPPHAVSLREAVITAPPSAEREEAERQLSQHLSTAAPWIPVLRLRSVVAVSPQVTGFVVDSHGRPRFDRLRLSSAGALR